MYPQLVAAAINRQDCAVNVDCANVATYSAQLYRNLVLYPSHVIPIMDIAINELSASSDPSTPPSRVQVRTFGLQETKSMRKLGPDDVEKLIAVRGMIVRVSQVIPNMRQANFRCTVCDHAEEVDVDIRDRIAEPTSCASCGSKASMAIVHNRCLFADKQVIRLQETPESIPEGETPQTVSLFAYDSLVDAVKPGDRVEITGIFRAEPVRSFSTQRTVRSLYRTCESPSFSSDFPSRQAALLPPRYRCRPLQKDGKEEDGSGGFQL